MSDVTLQTEETIPAATLAEPQPTDVPVAGPVLTFLLGAAMRLGLAQTLVTIDKNYAKGG